MLNDSQSKWLLGHGFVQTKVIEYTEKTRHVTYQKVTEDDNIIEVEMSIYKSDTVYSEQIIDVELFCPNSNGTHDSITLNYFQEY